MAKALFDIALLKKGSALLNNLNHSLRLQMLQAIHTKGRMTVTEIFTQFKLEQSVASTHLRSLRESNFVTADRVGKFVYYTVNHDRLNEVTQGINGFTKKNYENYLLQFTKYVMTTIDLFKPVAATKTYDGMMARLKSCSKMLKSYHDAIAKKRKDVLKEAKVQGLAPLEKLKKELDDAAEKGIIAYIEKHLK